jgi:sigma-B regulation protein RsbU (phosphoserine phosphatase)
MPVREVSGDFFDHFKLADGRICFCLADVSGKGVDAALLMAKASSLFHCLGKTLHDPARLLAVVNEELVDKAARGMFVTMVGGVFNPDDGTVSFANAGHNPPLFVGPDGAITEIPGDSPPLGIVPDAVFRETVVPLHEGSLYLYTDGLSELHTTDGGQLGTQGIKALIRDVREAPSSQRLELLLSRALSNSAERFDDITLLQIDAST